MASTAETAEKVHSLAGEKYKYGFVTDIEMDIAPKGLNEDIVRFISAKKNEPEWLLEWRLKAFRALADDGRAELGQRRLPADRLPGRLLLRRAQDRRSTPKSLDEVDPELLKTYEKLGIPLHEQELLAGVAVDAVFDSVSVATTFKKKLEEDGVIFCSISEAVQNHPELVRKYLGTVVPYADNFYATLNSAVFTDGSFVYIPKGVRCPMELSTYFRINAAKTGQFERTLIIADDGSLCQLSRRLHRADARREPAARGGGRAGRAGRRGDQVFDGAELVSRRRERQGRHLQLRHQARRLPRPQLQDLLDAGGNRLGDHLEVSELHPAGRQFASASSIRSRSPTTTSRPIPAPR